MKNKERKDLRLFSGIYTIKKVSKTNGVSWCVYEDNFGYPRVALLHGEYDNCSAGESYRCYVCTDNITTFLIVMNKIFNKEVDE